MGNQAYQAYAARLRAKHQKRFSESGIAPQFAAHFGHRVEVRFTYDSGASETKRGWISGTSGWVPSLMLMLRRNSRGSSWLLGHSDELVRVLDKGPR